MQRGTTGCGGAGARLETLEPRLLLSGNVEAFASAGNLYIVGDAESNDVVVMVQGAGSFEVHFGATSMTTVNGGTDAVDFTDITGGVFAFMGEGDDLLTFSLATLPPNSTGSTFQPNISGDLYVDMGPGDNSFNIGSGGEEIAGNMTIINGPGNNSVYGEQFIVDGAVTVLNGWGTASTEFEGCTFGSLFIQNAGGAAVAPTGLVPAGYATDTDLGQTVVNGNITLINGVGNDKVFMMVLANNAFISSGPDGLYMTVLGSEFAGSLLIYKGEGGAVEVQGSAPGADDSGTHEAASYLAVGDTDIAGTFISHDGGGLDELYMDMVQIGNVPGSVGRPDRPTGSMFIDTEEDASFIYMNDITVNGPTLIKQDGGTDTYTTQGFTTTTALIIGPLLDTGSVGNGSANQFYGDFTVINGPGNDGVAFADAHFWGNVLVLNGPDAAAFGVFNSFFEGALTWVRGDGGTLPSIPSFFNPFKGAGDPVGFTVTEASSYVTVQTATVAGPVTILNGAGYNYAEITRLTLQGSLSGISLPLDARASLLVVNGWGQSRFLMGSSTVAGSVTIIDVGGPSVPPALPTPLWTTDTEIGAVPANVGTTTNTRIGGDLTILTGAGNDWTGLTSVVVTGNVLVANGPDAASVHISRTDVGGSLTLLRGDGGEAPVFGIDGGPVGTFFISDSVQVFTTTVGGTTLVINGSGVNEVTLYPTLMAGDVTVIVGAGYADFSAIGAFGGSLSYYGAAAGSALSSDPVSIGAGNAASTVAGNLFIQTGAGDDAVGLYKLAVTGMTALDTGLGNDTVVIDDSTFNGAVNITTGPDYGAAAPLHDVAGDNDTVNIETVPNTTLGTVFNATLTIKTGIDNDTVTIGAVDSTEGLGATTNNCFAHFVVSASLDGGDGSDTLDYELNGNVFDGSATIDAVNVETVN